MFARQGYHATSTREIAGLAGVSENTLFRHFDHKEYVFWLGLQLYAKDLAFHDELEAAIRQCDSPEIVLPQIVAVLLDAVRIRPELLRLIAVAMLELQTKAEAFCRENFSPMLSSVHQYLAANMHCGRIRKMEPAILTTAFTMSVLMHPGLSKLAGLDAASGSNSPETVGGFSRFWLDTLAPAPLPHPEPVTAFCASPPSTQ